MTIKMETPFDTQNELHYVIFSDVYASKQENIKLIESLKEFAVSVQENRTYRA